MHVGFAGALPSQMRASFAGALPLQVRVGFAGALPSQVHVLHIAYGIMPFRGPERHFFIGKIQGGKGKAECCMGKAMATKVEGL